MTYADRNLAMLATLDPVARLKFAELLKVLDIEDNEDVLLTDGRRTLEQQRFLYAKGRTSPGPKVTDQPGDGSFHVWGVAVDIVPITVFGRTDYQAYDRYEQIARTAKELGIDWGYAMWGMDRPHFQYTQGLTIADFRAGRKPALPPQEASVMNLEQRLAAAENALRWAIGPRRFVLTRLAERLRKALLRA